METAERFRYPMKWLTGTLLAACLLIATSAAATVKVMVSPMPVFSEVNASHVSGYSVSLSKGILAEAGMDASVEAVPFARMLANLRREEEVLASAVVRLPEREEDFYWITPVSANRVTFYVKQSHPLANTSSPSFSNVSSAAVRRGDYRTSLLRDHGVENLMEVNNWTQAIEAVQKGRVDGLLFSDIGMSIRCKTAKMNCDDLVPVMKLDMTYSYLVLPRTPALADLAARLSQAAITFKQSEKFRNLVNTTLPRLSALGVEASESEGIVSFSGPLRLNAEDLWVMADQVPFFSERNSEGDVTGYAVELVRAILDEAGLDTPVLSAPWDRIAKESLKPNVMAFSVARTAERESQYHWITPITRNMHGLYSLSGQRFDSFKDVPVKRAVAVLTNDYREQIAREAGFEVHEFDTWEAATTALLEGDVDYLFGSRGAVDSACQALVAACEGIRLAATYRLITTYLVLSKAQTEPALVERLKAASVKVKQAPEFTRWAEAWGKKLNNVVGGSHHMKDGVIQLWSEQE
ncbi:substrate-binding periplasmic protein [Alteromonas halophila]|uniref:Solute-binding protein family 3/N-terminal domain-containing protein n=1 Tax=Alteromonas halophila TaxID=516698 RepID=A0A918MY16_9ALTE|nr:transporter substrate-binding domain-containing protein [Alteromonas halophila]GGW83345.1 hypothetical protein GCM10007391_15980 [Alteromonas halophila]